MTERKSRRKRITIAFDLLLSGTLARNLRSADPTVRAEATAMVALIDDELNRDVAVRGTTPGRTAYDLGVTIARNIRAGVKGEPMA